MGTSASANLEIDAFRLEGDPQVLNVLTVKKFLAELPAPGITIHNILWRSGYTDQEPGYEDTVNRPDGSEPIDEELVISASIKHDFNGRTYEYSLCSEPHGGNEYVGNAHGHTIVIAFRPAWDEDMAIQDFINGTTALLALRDSIVSRRLVSKRKISDCITTVTT